MLKYFLPLLLLIIHTLAQAQTVTMPIQGAPGLYVTVGIGNGSLIDLRNNPSAVNVTMGDDDSRLVPLGFTFPYFNQRFTESWMHSNGVVSFQNPSLTGNFCCTGQNLTLTTSSNLNYSIMPMWTDLIGTGSNNHYYLQGTNEITYGWYNVNEYGTQNTNNFEVKLNSAGLVDVRLQGAIISAGRPVTSGMTGNLAQGEYFQYYHGSGWNTGAFRSWAALDGTGGDICLSNPLSSPACPGYYQAYLTQQCTVSALYDPTCPGYYQANLTYQCSINPLYNELCPGYAQAYFNQQCSLNGLYSKECPNYSTAYAIQQLLSQNSSNMENTTTTTQPTSVTVEQPAATANPAAVTAIVPLTANPASAPTVTNLAQPAATTTTNNTKQEQETKPQTKAQEIQQARREAARREAAAKGKESMQAAAEAKSMEQQVATQGLIIAAMGYNAAFDAYSMFMLKDGKFYPSFEIYRNQNNVDNRRVLRQLSGASDTLHQRLVEEQYK